jgi:hypothetical protein
LPPDEISEPHTYFAKRKAEGKSKKEIFRCLKRYVAREVYRTLVDPRADAARSAA